MASNAPIERHEDPLAVECENCGEIDKALSSCKTCGSFISISLGAPKIDRGACSLQAMCEQDREDAERYRFLRRDHGPGAPFICIHRGSFVRWTEDAADAQVDEAIDALIERDGDG